MTRQVKSLIGTAAMAVAVGVVTSAQAPVTMTLRSGETMAVSLVDMGARGFEVRVNGAERIIAKDQVATVDFGGAVKLQPAWFNGLSPVNHLVVFKNGDTLLAEWSDVGGTSPLILRFNTPNGEREIPSDQVARIYLVTPPLKSVVGPTPEQGGLQPDGAVAVMASDPWTSAGITVRTGEYLRFAVSREIRFGPGANDTATADGNPSGGGVFRTVPVRSLPRGGLIGKVGNGQAFSIGSAPQPIRMPANGQLFLGINDMTFNDNSGWFRVVVTRGQ